MDSAQLDEGRKQEILDYLKGLEGKGVQTIAEIAKGSGIKRRELSKYLNAMEHEGLVAIAGVSAGVIGYKAVK